MRRSISVSILSAVLAVGGVACGGGSSGGGGESTARSQTATTIEGTFRSATVGARVLGAGEGGIPDVQVGALGDFDVTDENGNFTLSAENFAGGEVQFSFSGAALEKTVQLEGVAGGGGATAFTNFVLEDNGEISGESTDAAGNILGSTGGALGCTETGTFSDGGLGALWKPHSESTGTVVVLMPAEYRNASVEVFNVNGDRVATVLRQHCCQHNGGRAHFYLTQTAGSLAGAGVPLTVRFGFPDGRVDCREVPNPRQRYD